MNQSLHGGREFELTTNDPCMVLPKTPFVKALFRWATGKRLNDRLPKVSLITPLSGLNSLQEHEASAVAVWRGIRTQNSVFDYSVCLYACHICDESINQFATTT